MNSLSKTATPSLAFDTPNVSMLRAVMQSSPVPTFVLNMKHQVVVWNQACEYLTGIAAADMLGTTTPWRGFSRTERPVLADLVLDGQTESLPDLYPLFSRHSNDFPGAIEAEGFFDIMPPAGRWLAFTAAPVYDEHGAMCGAVETLQDVTQERRAQLALNESKTFLSEVIDGSSVAIFVINHQHQVTHWNRACELLTGAPSNQLIGTNQHWRGFYDQPRPILADIVLDGALHDTLNAFYAGKYRASALVPGAYEAEDFFPAFGDNGRWVFFTAAPIRNAKGEVVGAMETLQNITSRKLAEIALRKSEERYRILSQLDSLTQLFNSRHLYERLGEEIERALRYGRPLALMMIDADHFKRINDSFGHLEGDRVLQELARTIRNCLRTSDSAYRYGGEEFVVLMPETIRHTAVTVAERIRKQFAEIDFLMEGHGTLKCSVSIGISELSSKDTSITLLQRADQAAYKAKKLGRNRTELQ
jgi:diguanylate cyclase (GGDEF)-like protein